MSRKPVKRFEFLEVVYDEEKWELLGRLRAEALEMMEALQRERLNPIVYGSIARGDVWSGSDIDVFVPYVVPSFRVESAIEAAGFEALRRVMVQATPSYAVKAYIEVGEGRSFSFPLVKLRPVEAEFYRFAGSLRLEELRRGLRVPGVDKRLMLIEPTERGHVESSVVGRESYVASRLGIDVRTVLDRVRALTRRDEVGRTGVFLKRELAPGECFEDVLRRLADRNPAVRRRLMEGTS